MKTNALFTVAVPVDVSKEIWDSCSGGEVSDKIDKFVKLKIQAISKKKGIKVVGKPKIEVVY